jgi:DNA-binding response OmpR family regulator
MRDAADDERPLVLVVEDDAAVREVLVETLVGEMGLTAVAARDGHEGVRLALERAPALVMLDLGMPGLDGLAVIGRLRSDAATSALRVLAMTALGHGAEERQMALDAGALGILEKPFDLDDLIATVGALLREEPPPAQTGR